MIDLVVAGAAPDTHANRPVRLHQRRCAQNKSLPGRTGNRVANPKIFDHWRAIVTAQALRGRQHRFDRPDEGENRQAVGGVVEKIGVGVG